MTIYLDNAATSYPKPESVYRAVENILRNVGANPGRGGHMMALEAGRVVFETRETVADFFNIADSARIVFAANATEAINTGLVGLLNPGDRVVTSTMEHNAVTRPLRALQDRGIEVVKVPADRQGWVDPAHIRQACAEPTRLVVLTHCSNVTGTVQAIEDIGPWCRKQGILFMVDAAQSAGVFPIDVEEMAIDLLAAPGHKGLLGPQGTGFLYVRDGLQLTPLIYGGTGGNSHSEFPPEQFPERLEAGTVNTPGLAGLKAGIEFLNEVGLASIRARESELLEQLISGLDALAGVEIYGPRSSSNHGGALSLTFAGLDPSQIGFILDQEFGILTRVGLHCAPDAHRTIGTYPQGTVRVSPGYFNTPADIDRFLSAMSTLSTRT